MSGVVAVRHVTRFNLRWGSKVDMRGFDPVSDWAICLANDALLQCNKYDFNLECRQLLVGMVVVYRPTGFIRHL